MHRERNYSYGRKGPETTTKRSGTSQGRSSGGGLPDGQPAAEMTWAEQEALQQAIRLEVATQCTADLKAMLGDDIDVEPEDWIVSFSRGRNVDSGDDGPLADARLYVEGICIVFEKNDYSRGDELHITCSVADIGRALRAVAELGRANGPAA